MSEVNRSEYNSNLEIAKRVGELTNLVCVLLPQLRYNGAVSSTALDWMLNLWDELKPVATTSINAKIYAVEIAEIDGLFSKLFLEAVWQEKRASKWGKMCGADAGFLADIHHLKSMLQVMGQRLGLGMSVRRFSSHDTHDDL